MGTLRIILVIFLITQTPSPCNSSRNECPQVKSKNYYKFVVEDAILAPDNFLQAGKTINGLFPGPTIEIYTNERLVVEVHNKLLFGLTIHWHGIDQIHSVEADGVPQVTQYPIPTNESYTYIIDIGSQPGTYMYHGHSRFDIVWVHGALIVKDDPREYKNYPEEYQYDFERILILEQLYHVSIEEYYHQVLTGGDHPPPISNAINGRSYGIWPDSNANTEGYYVTKVQKGLTYRFRIINLSADSKFRFEIANHKLTVIEMDEVLTEPVETDHVDIFTGQRYSVLITMDQDVDNYFIRSQSTPGPGPDNGYAILHYEGASDPTPLRTIVTNNYVTFTSDMWVTPELTPNLALRQNGVYPIPKTVDQTFTIDFQFMDSLNRFALDGNLFTEPEVPYLFQVRHRKNVTENPQVFEIMAGNNVQILFQGRVVSGKCVAHPWHIHGHNFYVAASGPDLYDEKKDAHFINKIVANKFGKFQFRDTFIHFPLQSVPNTTVGAGCGWYAVRFVADNPGMWFAHCHITRHMIQGLAFVIWEHTTSNPMLFDE